MLLLQVQSTALELQTQHALQLRPHITFASGYGAQSHRMGRCGLNPLSRPSGLMQALAQVAPGPSGAQLHVGDPAVLPLQLFLAVVEVTRMPVKMRSWTLLPPALWALQVQHKAEQFLDGQAFNRGRNYWQESWPWKSLHAFSVGMWHVY